MCSTWQESVPAIGLTFCDHRQPGSKVPRPTEWPLRSTTSTRPLPSVNSLTSSGLSNRFPTSCAILTSWPLAFCLDCTTLGVEDRGRRPDRRDACRCEAAHRIRSYPEEPRGVEVRPRTYVAGGARALVLEIGPSRNPEFFGTFCVSVL